MERRKLDTEALPPTSHVQEEMPRSDVPFPYGTDDGTSQTSLASFALRLGTTADASGFAGNAPLRFANTPVLVTRGSATKGAKGPLVCHVEGCQRDLSLEKKYYKRYRVCMEHLKMSSIYVDGELQRFCQQCGRFHDLAKFDGEKRNCRERLSQHNRRRRKSKRELGGSDGSWEEFSQDQPPGKEPKGRRSKRLIQKTSPSELWTGGHPGYDDGAHGMTSEEQSALGSVGMEMMQGIPVGVSGAAALHPFVDGMALPDGQPNAQERESLYNMVVHHVMPNTQLDSTKDGKKLYGGELSANSLGITSGSEALHSLTTLLQIPESSTNNEGGSVHQATAVNAPLVGVQGGVGMLQSVCVSSPGGSMPTVPMLVFPSSSAPHQLSAVAIIPSATSSCSTIVPLPWQGTSQQLQTIPQPSPSLPQSSLPFRSMLPTESSTSTTTAEETPEIAPLVSLALSASGIAQAAGSHAYHPAISQNQLAHFQMLMARQTSMGQTTDVVIPQATADAVQNKIPPDEDIKKEDDEMPPPK